MNELILTIPNIIGLVFGLFALYSMPSDFLKEFEKSCHESIEKGSINNENGR